MSIGNLELLIIDRLLEAQVCMRRLNVRNVAPGQPSTFWPETSPAEEERFHVVLEQLKEGIKTDDPLRPRRTPPSAAAITRMEETWQWVADIKDDKARKAVSIKVFAWVHQISTSSLAKAMGINRVTLNRRFNAGLEELLLRFCKSSVLPEPVDEELVHQFRPKSAMNNRNIAASAA